MWSSAVLFGDVPMMVLAALGSAAMGFLVQRILAAAARSSGGQQQWSGAALLLVLIGSFTAAREGMLVYHDWVHEQQNQRDKAEMAATCHAIETTKLRYANGTNSDCRYAMYVTSTTPGMRTLENWTSRLTTFPTLYDWLRGNWLLALSAALAALVLVNFLQAQTWPRHAFEEYRQKILMKQLLRAGQQQQQAMKS